MKRVFSVLLAMVMLMVAMPLSFASVSAVVYGDVNGDGKINNRDLGVLQQYLNDYDVAMDDAAADVNNDDRVNNRDLGLLQQYLNDWDVTLGPGEGNAIRILAVGDSYAVDAVENHLYHILKSGGYDTVELGILYTDSLSVDSFYADVKANSGSYEFRRSTDGTWTKQSDVTPSTALKAAKWDAIVLQQDGALAGISDSYTNLNKMTAAVQQQCTDATIYWHMTWSFRRQSDIDGFANYKYNEKTMYQAVVNATLKQVMRNNDIMGLIPTATAIQNLRTTPLRDSLNSDGVQLDDGYGDYAAALTWYAILSGESVTDVSYRPAAIGDQFDVIAEAVDNAINVPNEVTGSENEQKDLKILSIGHSFSLDAMRTYMWDLFDAAGYNVTIGYLYYPSCSLEQHWHYINNNSKSYEQYGKNETGDWVTQYNVDAKTALWDEDWDIITFQPDPDYGHGKTCYCEWGCNQVIDNDYVHFNDLVDLVLNIVGDERNPNGPNTDVDIYYHLTWTWRKDCYLYNSVSRGYDQQTLWQAFIDATETYITPNEHVQGVIPCNTAIQNARTTWMGDTFNAEGSNDGYHLSDKGDLVAALTWVSYFTGVKASKIYADVPYSDAEYAAFAEAVDNAIAHPVEVTPSSYPTAP